MFIPEDDKCSASLILNEAIISSGVNVLAHDADKIWSCDRASQDSTQAINPPPPCPKAGVTCYSHHTSGYPALCLEEPSLESTTKDFKEIKVQETFPRFKSIFVLKKSVDEYSQNTFWEMDQNKCHPDKMTTTHKYKPVDVDPKKCLERLEAFLKGGDTKKGDSKYCDPSKINDESYAKDVLADAEELARCSRMYPRFLKKFQEHRNSLSEKIVPTSSNEGSAARKQ